MRRKLSGSLAHLAPRTLLRLLAAAETTGVLELETASESLAVEIVNGLVERPEGRELKRVRRLLAAEEGRFRFEPRSTGPEPAYGVALASLLELSEASDPPLIQFASDLDVDKLLASEVGAPGRATEPRIHQLSSTASENPLDDLLSELEETAPEELLFAQVGVVATDPRVWRGGIEKAWRRRGWKISLLSGPGDVRLPELDAMVIYHHLSVMRLGSEKKWLDLVEASGAGRPSVPVVWVGPLGDPVWVHRLIEAGVAFLMPAPQGDAGEPWTRFQDSITAVVARLLLQGEAREADRDRLAEQQLIEALLHGWEGERGVSVLLQVASGSLQRAAVLAAEETAVRCRAGFGYHLGRGGGALPRGVGLVERVIRLREPALTMDPESAAGVQLARVLGEEALPQNFAVLPLCVGPHAVGVLVGDRNGENLEDLDELALLARRMGGVILDLNGSS